MIRTLILSERDFTGEELRRVSATRIAEGFINGDHRLTAEPGHDEVLRLLRAGLLEVVICQTVTSSFVGLTPDGKDGVTISRTHTQTRLGDWVEGGRRRQELP